MRECDNASMRQLKSDNEVINEISFAQLSKIFVNIQIGDPYYHIYTIAFPHYRFIALITTLFEDIIRNPLINNVVIIRYFHFTLF
jgi:hypothetical protein